MSGEELALGFEEFRFEEVENHMGSEDLCADL